MFSSLYLLSLAALAPLARATVFITNPTASSSLPAGQQATIAWQDDGKSPSLASFGNATVGLYVGNQQQQTQLQLINPSVNVSLVNTITWTPDTSVGENFGQYFIRFTSIALADPSQPNANAEAFSAKFALSGMTGHFNSSIQSEISGTVAATGSAASATGSGSGAGSTTRAAGTPSTPASASTAKASGAASTSKSSSGAGHIAVPRILVPAGIAAITFAFFH